MGIIMYSLAAAALAIWLWGVLLLSEGRTLLGGSLIAGAVVIVASVIRLRSGNWKGVTSAIVEAFAEIFGNR